MERKSAELKTSKQIKPDIEANKHKLVDSDHNDIVDYSLATKKKVTDWFDDEDDGNKENTNIITELKSNNNLNDEFELRPALDSKQMMDLQRTFKGDTRFKLDQRFADTDNDNTDSQILASTIVANNNANNDLKQEKLKTLELLDELLPTAKTKQSKALSMIQQKASNNINVSQEHKAMEARLQLEDELEMEKKKKQLYMWRNVQRFDPNDSQAQQLIVKHNGKSYKNEAITVEGEDLTIGLDFNNDNPDDENNDMNENYNSNDEMDNNDYNDVIEDAVDTTETWQVKVPRLRDLVTEERKPFSLASLFGNQFNATDQPDNNDENENISASGVQELLSTANEQSLDSEFALNVKSTNNKPNRASKQPTPATLSQIEPNTVINGMTNSSNNNKPDPSNTKPKFSLHSLLQQVSTPDNDTNAPLDAKSTSNSMSNNTQINDVTESFQFMRSVDADTLQAEWLKHRSDVTIDFKRKNKTAIRNNEKTKSSKRKPSNKKLKTML
jgi:hypothetical protein